MNNAQRQRKIGEMIERVMRSPTYTTQSQVRAAYWDECSYERNPGAKQNDYPADVRQDFCAFVESLARDGHISEALAQRVTL